MKSITRRFLAAAGALAMAGGVLAATAMPASASGGDPASWALETTGFLGSTGPVLLASSPGPGFRMGSEMSYHSLLRAEDMIDTATPETASSSIGSMRLSALSGQLVLTATGVHSSCSNNEGEASGFTLLANGTAYFGPFPFPLPFAPSANDTFFVPQFGTVTLNRQVPDGPNGVLVTAIYAHLFNGTTISIGNSECEGFDIG